MQHPCTRPRRLRMSAWSRHMLDDVVCRPAQFVAPLFVHDGCLLKDVVEKLPGICVYSEEAVLDEVAALVDVGIVSILLFPVIDARCKDARGSVAIDESALIPRVIRRIKAAFPQVGVMADVALDPYTTNGHDGICDDDGTVINDETVEILVRQAFLYADAGVDVIAPSDMMDGRVKGIRDMLELHGHVNVHIMSYTTKYASALYGPFRAVVGASALLSGGKDAYQMSMRRDAREASSEAYLDVAEGADILMVKPALFYLDIIRHLRQTVTLPIAAYQVSGEYAMIISAAAQHYIDRKQALIESWVAMKRAGADIIISYAAKEAAQWSQEGSL